MERETDTTTVEDKVRTAEKDPRDTTPRGNPPTDHEAVRKGEEILSRVKAY